MKCAIVTCSEHKKRLFKKGFVIEEIFLPQIPESITLISLCYTADQFYLLSERKKEKLAKQILAALNRASVFCIYLSGITDCPEFIRLKLHFYHPDGKKLIKKFAAEGALSLSKQCHIPYEDAKIALYQKNFNHTGFEVLTDLARFFSNITIIGISEEELSAFSEKLLNLYGLSAEISTKLTSANSCDFLLLLSEPSNISFSEKTIVVDLTKTYPFHCLNALKFTLPQTYNKILPYFGEFNDICIEFLLYASNSYADNKEEIISLLSFFGGKFKTFCAKSKIRLDN